jgi:hypothetical protein
LLREEIWVRRAEEITFREKIRPDRTKVAQSQSTLAELEALDRRVLNLGAGIGIETEALNLD